MYETEECFMMIKPELRFIGFKGEWESVMFDRIGFTFSGLTGKTKEDFGTGSSQYITFLNVLNNARINTDILDNVQVNKIEYQNEVRKGDLFFNTSSETPEEVGMCSVLDVDIKNVYLNSFCFGFRLIDSNIEPLYIAYLMRSGLGRQKMSILAQGATRFNLSKTNFKEIEILVPSIEEQQQIATYFVALDKQISSASSRLASLKQVKAASLQAKFPQKGEKVPKIRFNGFEGEWESVKLSSFAKRIMRKNSNLESTLALTIASTLGLVSQNDYFNSSVVGANISNYYLLKKGEFAYNKSYSNGYPFGSVKRLDRYEQGILSVLYIVFGIDNSISSDYLTHFFDTTLWHKDVAERAAEGARNHGLLNISAEDFFDISVLKPKKIEEQQQIAAYFTALDKQIALQTQRLEKLKQIKAACLDKMFV